MKQAIRYTAGFLAAAMMAAPVNMAVMADEVAPQAEGIPVDEEHFPDPTFRAYINLAYAGDDGYLSDEEIAGVKLIWIGSPEVRTLEGIEYFTELEALQCSYVSFDSIDLSSNTKLINLACVNCGLESLILPATDTLIEVFASGNNLTTLELNAPNLNLLSIYDNSIEIIDISGSPILVDLVNSSAPSFVDGHLVFKKIVDNVFISTIEADEMTGYRREEGGPVLSFDEPESPVAGFISRLYSNILEREADEGGINYWISQVEAGATGADIATFFLYSDEFMNNPMCTECFVAVLYRVFFNREPDEGGLTYWTGEMTSRGKAGIIAELINSTEWANVCLTYGIPSGGLGTADIELKPTAAIISFCERLYTDCMFRHGEPGGISYWSSELVNHRIGGTEVARQFFFSEEYVNRGWIDDTFINSLYKTFFNRAADEAGLEYWRDQLDSGVSREEVFEQFTGTDEWTNTCRSVGIDR